MKTVLLEPTFKKSLLEFQVWEKEIDGKMVRATMETGWRWGSFLINIPETEEEILEWANERVGQSDYYTDMEHILGDYGQDTIEDLTKYVFCPNENDDFIEINDYDFEMQETWDGCWEEWTVKVPSDSDFDEDEIREEVEEGWQEDSYDYMESNGWLEVETYYELHCNPKISELDENGEPIVNEDLEINI